MDTRAIGFFDSGVGGLSVIKQMQKQLPKENIIYIGDSKRAPYGIKTNEEITQYSLEMVEFLVAKDIKMLVIACNTATSVALETIKQNINIPVIGVITSGVNAAIRQTKNNQIGVIATQATIKQNQYEKEILEKNKNITVNNLATSEFVELVETSNHNQAIINQTLSKLPNKTKLDTLILGCTHFPFIKKEIEQSFTQPIKIIDSGKETVNQIANLLNFLNIENHTHKERDKYYTTGDVSKFETIANKWLDENIKVEQAKTQKNHNSNQEIIIATQNQGKIKEFKEMLPQFTIKSLQDFDNIPEIIENGNSFYENALIKAKTLSKILGEIVVADDSGLEVESLNNRPGIYSARYAGVDTTDQRNNAKLLSELAEFQNKEQRKARFVSCIVMYNPNTQEVIQTLGELKGAISNFPKGENGFGYDPIFIPDNNNKTLAQMSLSEKNKISHRKQAMDNLKKQLQGKI